MENDGNPVPPPGDGEANERGVQVEIEDRPLITVSSLFWSVFSFFNPVYTHLKTSHPSITRICKTLESAWKDWEEFFNQEPSFWVISYDKFFKKARQYRKRVVDFLTTGRPALELLFPVWYQSRLILIESLEDLQAVHDYIIPQPPEIMPFYEIPENKDSTSLRELCFWMNMNLLQRLFFSSCQFLSHALNFFCNSQNLNRRQVAEIDDHIVGERRYVEPVQREQQPDPVQPIQGEQQPDPVQPFQGEPQPDLVQPLQDVQQPNPVQAIQEAPQLVEAIQPFQNVQQFVEPVQDVQQIVEPDEPVQEDVQQIVEPDEPVQEDVQQIVEPDEPVQEDVQQFVEPVEEVERLIEPDEPVQVVQEFVEPFEAVQVVQEFVEPFEAVQVVQEFVEPFEAVQVVQEFVEPVEVVQELVEPVEVVEQLVEAAGPIQGEVFPPIRHLVEHFEAVQQNQDEDFAGEVGLD